MSGNPIDDDAYHAADEDERHERREHTPMTAHSKDEGLREALQVQLRALAERVLSSCERLIQDSCTAKDIKEARALLSSSAAERAVREALKKMVAGFETVPPYMRESFAPELTAALAALSSARAGEEEQEQARSPSALSAPASNGMKGQV